MADNKINGSNGVPAPNVALAAQPTDFQPANGKEEFVPSKTAVLERSIPWDGYQRVGLVKQKQFGWISAYDRKGITDAERSVLLEKVGAPHFSLFHFSLFILKIYIVNVNKNDMVMFIDCY